MKLSEGFPIEAPPVVVPWGIKEGELIALLPSRPTHVTDGYYTMRAVSLGGMQHTLGFHFEPRSGGRLVELEFFRLPYSDLGESYAEWQQHLENTFGSPTSRQPGDEGFDSCRWVVDGVHVSHYIFDRFGPEEHVRMRRA